MKTIRSGFLLAVLAAGLVSGCGPMVAPWHSYKPPVVETEDFFGEFYNCVGSAFRAEQMNVLVKVFAPVVPKKVFRFYPVPAVSKILKIAKDLGSFMAIEHPRIEAMFKETLSITPAQLDSNLSSCFALMRDNPDAAGRTAEDLRLFAEVMRKWLGSSAESYFEVYNINYRRYMLTLAVLEMGMAKQAGPDEALLAELNRSAEVAKKPGVGGAMGGPGAIMGSISELNRALESGDKGRINDALGKAEKAMDATEADTENLHAMLDVVEGHGSGSMNDDEAKAALLKLDKARKRNEAAFESAGEGDGTTVGENVGKARTGIGGVKSDLAAKKKSQCQHLLRDLKEVKTKCDAGKKIFCEAFSEKREEFVKKCGKEMLPKGMEK